MTKNSTSIVKRKVWSKLAILSVAFVTLLGAGNVSALGSSQNPQSGSTGVQGEISGPPPSTAPSVSIPHNGQVFSSIPITVSGLCSGSLLVKVFVNGVFVGSTVCKNGSYTLKVDLFSGRNEIVVRQYDGLGQQSPASATTVVTFNPTSFSAFGQQVRLTSDYAERGANPGQTLTWPITISGGTGPYAVSVDWGDGKPADLFSQANAGALTLKHVYDTAGTYNVIVKATDKTGTAAYLQLVGVANGAITSQASGSSSKNNNTTTKTKVLWWPSALSLLLVLLSFWLGRRFELASLRKRIEKGWHS